MKYDTPPPFGLGKIKGRCPGCGRPTFKFYVDKATGVPLDATCGRCNREINCGYHLPPREYFRTHGRPMQSGLISLAPAKPSRPSFIPPAELERLQTPELSTLGEVLARRYGEETVRETERLMGVTRHPRYGGSTAFWLRDARGDIRSAKIMAYDSEGHRVKTDSGGRVVYLHTILGLEDFNYTACYFGEHLAAANPGDSLLVVESEKTALILTLEMRARGIRGYTALATGGASMLKPDRERLREKWYRSAVFRKRRVVLIPDADMTDRWCDIAGDLTMCSAVRCLDLRRPPFSLTGSQDIADFLLK